MWNQYTPFQLHWIQGITAFAMKPEWIPTKKYNSTWQYKRKFPKPGESNKMMHNFYLTSEIFTVQTYQVEDIKFPDINDSY